jgi:hypothetical protein
MSLITKSTYLRGPKGERGLAGPRGERGLAGAQGPQGIQGPDSDSQYIRGQFSGSGNITYNFNTGVIGFTNPGYATTTYVDIALANLVGNAPAILDTLKEIADAINNDPNFYNNKLSISGDTMTGALILNADPIANLGAATKQYVDAATLGITVNDTDDVPEGNDNLYYTTARANTDFDTRLATKTTTNLTEGGNLYYTDTRSRNAISVTGSGSYNSSTGVITVTGGVTSVNTKVGDVTLNTTDVSEGSNLYYTDTRARTAISVTGNLNYNSSTGVISYTEPGRGINDLTDVDTTTIPPTNGQVLAWSSAESTWKPNTISGSGGNSGGDLLNISITTYDYDATAGQTIFSGADSNGVLLLMNPGNYIQVYKNGSLLRIDNNWTYNIGVLGGDNITLTSPASLGDWIHIEVKDITDISTDLILDGGSFIMSGSIVDGGSY